MFDLSPQFIDHLSGQTAFAPLRVIDEKPSISVVGL